MTPRDVIALVRRNPLYAGISIVLVVILAAYGARNLIFGTPVPVYVATRGDLLQTVIASGRVITPQRATIAAESTGRVIAVPVAEGETVERGQVLIELDQSDERAALTQARAGIAQAEAKLRQLELFALPAADESLRQAQSNILQARQQYQRMQDLVARNFVAKSQLDDAQRNLDVATSQLRAAELQKETDGPSGSDYAMAKTALEQARADLLAATARLDATTIRAPSHGTLIGRSVEAGDVAEAGKELMVLAPIGETQLVVQIDEMRLAELALGQPALGSADAYPAKRFAAELVYINPGVDSAGGAVEVKLRVIDPPAYLVQDMTVSVDIEVGRRSNALVVPAEAVHDAAGALPWALVIRDGHTVRRPITMGLRGDRHIEVVAGLDEGDELVPVTNAAVVAGRHVRGVVTDQDADDP